MKSLTILLTLIFSAALFAGKVSFKKGDGFNPATKTIVTMAPYNSKSKKVDNKDAALDAFEKVVALKMADVYDKTIPGGDAVMLAADELGIKKEFEKALTTIVQVAIDKKSTSLDAAKGTLDKLAPKLGVESFAFPVGKGGSKELSDKKEIKLYVVVYDVAAGKVQYVAETKVKLPKMLFMGFGISKDKIKKAATAQATDAGNDIMKKVKEEVKK
jgi:hypothetical protein